MEHTTITTADGTPMPLTWYPSPSPRCAMLVLPALGIQAKLYDKLGAQLAERGCSVCIMEQRGHGRSPVVIGRGNGHTLGDILDFDVPAAMTWMSAQSPGQPQLLGGHSLGGHLSTIYSGLHPDQLDGVVHLACAFPYHRDYAGRAAMLIRLLTILMPLFTLVPRYFPGHRLGFGGRESLAMMKQWSEWASTGRFEFGNRGDLAQGVSAFTKPVISISFDRDDFATPKAIQRAMSPFTRARVTSRHLGQAEQGTHLGHTGWARDPAGVVTALVEWMNSEFQEDNS